ncbi:MAG: hypothetical protein NE330_05485 [Lentisphaeraceae bacterium]|nr:hypothetical protein [Lentisphaeraceae bacterium]
MSYFNYPRLHFSGKFMTDVSTFNNYPGNYTADGDLSKMQLFWNPNGTGGFDFEDCVVTKVDYADGTSATTPSEDSIVGQSVSAVKEFILKSAMVDLDPRQQIVSTIFGLKMQLGEEQSVVGDFSPTPFNGIWNFPANTALANYQGTLSDLSFTDNPTSKFLQQAKSESKLSVNFAVSQYNISPPLYSFNTKTFVKMKAAGVPEDVLADMKFLQGLSQYQGTNGDKKGDIPTESYVKKLLSENLKPEVYNEYINTILEITKKDYTNSTPFDFKRGSVVGTIGPSEAAEPTFAVAQRALVPQCPNHSSFVYFNYSETTGSKVLQANFSTAFKLEEDTSISPLPIKLQGAENLFFAIFKNNSFKPQDVELLHDEPLPLTDDFYVSKSGYLDVLVNADVSETPVGIVRQNKFVGKSGAPEVSYEVIHAENTSGYYMRADKFVYRMNPNVTDEQYGEKAEFKVHLYKFGVPASASENISISLSQFNVNGGTTQIEFDGAALAFDSTTVPTENGIATFKMTASEPSKPVPDNLDGDVFLINYNFGDQKLSSVYTPASGDTISVHVYESEVSLTGKEVLQQYGEIYPVMSWLMDESLVKERKGMVLSLLQQPLSSIAHMPVTRDMSIAKRKLAIEWVESL